MFGCNLTKCNELSEATVALYNRTVSADLNKCTTACTHSITRLFFVSLATHRCLDLPGKIPVTHRIALTSVSGRNEGLHLHAIDAA